MTIGGIKAMAKYNWDKFGFHIPEIMVPKVGTDYSKWAVVACDQYTSEPEYWERVEEIVGDAPSTLRLMLPEIFLDKEGEAERIKAIRETMDKYMADGTLETLAPGCMLVKRTAEGRTRLGLVIATDLEAYDFNKGSKSLTRATEGTVVERIPPRLRIREGAPIELPHILILIDDPEKSVIEPLVNAPMKQIYDTDLMLEGGHITGCFIEEKDLEGAKDALSELFDKAVEKYGEGNVIFQAMGDGNHSLATAKTNWENIKKTLSPEEAATHPARYALCEIENIHDEGIVFEPIHRVIFAKNGQSGEELVKEAVELLNEQNEKAYKMCIRDRSMSLRDLCLVRKNTLNPFVSNIVSGSAVPVKAPKISVCPIKSTSAACSDSLLIGVVATASACLSIVISILFLM